MSENAQSARNGVYVNDVEYVPENIEEMLNGLRDQEKRLGDVRTSLRQANDNLARFQSRVRSTIAELHENGRLDKETANEALEELDLEKLTTRYTATVRVTLEVNFESSEDPDDIEASLMDLDVEANYYGSDLENFDVDTVSVASVDDLSGED